MNIYDVMTENAIASIENPTKGFKNQVKLYMKKVEALKTKDKALADDLVDFFKVLVDSKFTGFFDVPDRIYHLSPGVNQSSLKDCKRSQGKYYHNRYVSPKEMKSEAITEGTFIHDLILTPENLENYYNDSELKEWAIKAYEDEKGSTPKNIRATSIYKEQKTAIEKEGKILISGDLYDNLDYLRAEILDHDFFKNLAKGGIAEKGMYCICKTTGLIKRGKCDLISSDGYIVDLKTVDESFSLDPQEIGRRMYNMGQVLQAPHYLDIFETIQGFKAKNFLYMHIERRAPFETNIGPLDAGASDKAEQDYYKLLEIVGNGYSEEFKNRKKAIKINPISIPHWAFSDS